MEENNKRKIKENYMKLVKNAISDLKTKGKRYKQIPNVLSTIRIFAPIFIIPVAALNNIVLFLIFILLFGITDIADGVIARKYKLQSELGKDLDAVADKVYASTLLIAAAFMQPALVINFLFELAIASINLKAKIKMQNPESHIIGKVKAWFLYILIGLGFLSSYIKIDIVFNIFFIGTTVVQTITAIIYLFKYRKDNNKVTSKNISNRQKIVKNV